MKGFQDFIEKETLSFDPQSQLVSKQREYLKSILFTKKTKKNEVEKIRNVFKKRLDRNRIDFNWNIEENFKNEWIFLLLKKVKKVKKLKS